MNTPLVDIIANLIIFIDNKFDLPDDHFFDEDTQTVFHWEGDNRVNDGNVEEYIKNYIN